MLRIEGVIISRPALANMRRNGTALLVIRIVVEVARLLYRLLLPVLPPSNHPILSSVARSSHGDRHSGCG